MLPRVIKPDDKYCNECRKKLQEVKYISRGTLLLDQLTLPSSLFTKVLMLVKILEFDKILKVNGYYFFLLCGHK